MIDLIGGPDRDRTDDLFHAMEARSQLRHRPTLGGLQLPYCLRSGPIRQTAAGTAMEGRWTLGIRGPSLVHSVAKENEPAGFGPDSAGKR